MAEQIPKQTKQNRESIWIEKRREILERLRQKVNVVSAMLRKAEELKFEDRVVVEKELYSLWHEVSSGYDPALVANAEQYVTLNRKYAQKKVEYEEAQNRNRIFDLNLAMRYGKFFKETELKMERLLDRDDTVAFLAVILNQINQMAIKNHMLAQLPEDRESLVQAINSIENGFEPGKKLAPEDISRIEEQAFSVNLIFPEKVFDKKLGSADGMHFTGTPVNVIREGSPAKERELIRHENVHNLTDELLSVASPISVLNQLLEKYAALRLSGVAPDDASDKGLMMAQVLKALSNPDMFLNCQHGEIAAAYKFAEEHTFGLSRKSNEPRIYMGVWQTAGIDYNKFIALIESVIAVREDLIDILVKILKKLKDSYIRSFTKMVEMLVSFSETASIISEKAGEDIEILFLLLKPSEYRHVGKYLEVFYGASLVTPADEKKLLALDNLFDIFSLTKLREAIEVLRVKPRLLDKRKRVFLPILSSLAYMPIHGFSRAGMSDMQQLREYLAIMGEYIGMFGQNSINAEEILSHIRLEFMRDYLQKEVSGDFVGLNTFYSGLDEAEKTDLKNALKKFIKRALIRQSLSKASGNLDEITSQGWKVLEESGFGDILAEAA